LLTGARKRGERARERQTEREGHGVVVGGNGNGSKGGRTRRIMQGGRDERARAREGGGRTRWIMNGGRVGGGGHLLLTSRLIFWHSFHPSVVFSISSVCTSAGDRLRVGWLNEFGRGTTRTEDAQGTPTQSHISPSILVYEETRQQMCWTHGCGVLDTPM